jgi:hypothetical protein
LFADVVAKKIVQRGSARAAEAAETDRVERRAIVLPKFSW